MCCHLSRGNPHSRILLGAAVPASWGILCSNDKAHQHDAATRAAVKLEQTMLIAMQNAGIDPPPALIDDGIIHRYAGPNDKEKKNWYILYPPTNGLQAGSFGRWSGADNGAIKWCSKEQHTFTEEEKKEYARRQQDARRKQAEDRQRAADECAAWCKEAWAKACQAPEDHPYLVKKQVKPFGLKSYNGSLMVPVKDVSQNLHGIQFIQADGTKKFKTGTAKAGHFHMIGRPVDNLVIITEGYATAASIHMATGHCVFVAFDAGNLQTVAEFVHKRQPAWRIVIAADNDRWAKEMLPDGSIKYHPVPCTLGGIKRINTGYERAEEAVKAVGGILAVPQFKDDCTHPTDFNDLHGLEGLEEVKRQIIRPTLPIAEYVPPPTDDDSPPPAEIDLEQFQPHELHGMPFIPLGYDQGEYFFLPHGCGQVKIFKPDAMSKKNLMTLAPLQQWEGSFQGKQGFNADAAANCLIQTSHKIGIYDSDRIRGLGAWEDKGRSVLHLGDVLVVDGKRTQLNAFKTRYIYERAISIADEEIKPLKASEAAKVIELCDMLSWEKPINGRLLAGWCVAAVICGALKWRPHMWLTGPSGTGKSSIIDNIIKALIGPFLKNVLSTTTEAGLRNLLGCDAFSVFFDEFEAEDRHAGGRIKSILEFARPASCNTDAAIIKAKMGGGGVNRYQPRSCIGWASVGVSLTQLADVNRVSVLTLKKGDQDHFNNTIVPFWTNNLTDAFCRGFRARAISLIPTIRANCDVFQRAVTERLGSRRGGDQYGTLLACAFSLCSSNIQTPDQAREWVNAQDWTEQVIAEDQSDERRCLQVILGALVRCEDGIDRSIGELLQDIETTIGGDGAKEKVLIRHGVKHVHGGFNIANQHEGIKKILANTPWAENWKQMLARLPMATKSNGSVARFGACVSAFVALPIKYVLEE